MPEPPKTAIAHVILAEGVNGLARSSLVSLQKWWGVIQQMAWDLVNKWLHISSASRQHPDQGQGSPAGGCGHDLSSASESNLRPWL